MTDGKDSEGKGPGQTPTTQKTGGKGGGKGAPATSTKSPAGGSK